MAKLESALGFSECRVLELSPGNANVQIDHPVAENQAVTLIMERLGELSGVVAWQREGCIGIRIIEHRAFGSGSMRTLPGGWTAARAEAAPPREAPLQPETRERADPAAPAPEGIAVERWGGDPDLLEVFRDQPRIIALQPGEILFKEGDPGTSMYVVRDGVLRIRSGSVVYDLCAHRVRARRDRRGSVLHAGRAATPPRYHRDARAVAPAPPYGRALPGRALDRSAPLE